MTTRRHLDARLIVGLLLVAGAVAGVVALVAALDRRIPVYVAGDALSPGEPLSSATLVERDVLLDDAAERYLRVGDRVSEGLVVTRPIPAGELIPLSALGEASAVDLTAVVIAPRAALSRAVVPGARVELWATRPSDASDAAEPPVTLVPEAIVVEVSEDSGFVSMGGQTAVEILIPRDRLARVLQAIADDAALALVPAGVPGVPT